MTALDDGLEQHHDFCGDLHGLNLVESICWTELAVLV